MKGLVFILALMMAEGMSYGAGVPSRTPMDKLAIRLRQTNIQIQRDERAGKLTKVQAKALKAQVEAIRKQEITFLKQDNSKVLTDAQIAQLNQRLNNLSKQ